MKVFVGDDWAEAHHDVHLMNNNGDKLAAKDSRGSPGSMQWSLTISTTRPR